MIRTSAETTIKSTEGTDKTEQTDLPPIKVLLGEDHEVLRDGLKSLLKEDAEIKVVGEAASGKEVILQVENTKPDLVLLDVNLPEMSGLEVTAFLKKEFPQVKILILSMLAHEKYAQELLNAGADGYAVKNIGKSELIFAIKKVMKNQLYISSEINLSKIKPDAEEDKASYEKYSLSKREMEVLKLIAEGFTNKEIAIKLFTSKRTIESHRKNLIEKTGAKNTASLIKFAITQKILS